MQVLVLSDNVPEPATHGGRLAIKNEIEALRFAGHEVHVVAFHRGQLSETVADANRALSTAFDAVPRPSLLRSTLRRPWLPYQVSSRALGRDVASVARGHTPELIICHHEWTLPAAFDLAGALGGVPVVLRAHNNELTYFHDVARDARGAYGLYLSSEYLRLRLFLSRVRADRVAEVWFMSAADVARPWSDIPHRIIPPVLFPEAEPLSGGHLPIPDGQIVAFVGALDEPHTIAGVTWFVDKVWRLILGAVPGARLLVAGSRPGPALSERIEKTAQAQLVVGPDRLEEIFAQTRVFINPILPGATVNLTLGPSVSRSIPTVTTTMGLRGLDGLRPHLSLADTPDAFARHCATLVLDDREWRQAARAVGAAAGAYAAVSVGRLLDEAIRHCVLGAPIH